MSLPSSRCPICKMERPVKKDGTFKKHRDVRNYVYRYPEGYPTCKGSGTKPTQ